MKTCCFTGHRMISAQDVVRLRVSLSETIEALYKDGVRDFLCGGAIGFDTLAAKTILDKKRTLPDIRLLLAIPCRNQYDRWSDAQKMVYHDILSCADDVQYLAESYDRGCMLRRNRYMVDHSDVCVAFYNGSSHGGTSYTVNYAYQCGLRVILL